MKTIVLVILGLFVCIGYASAAQIFIDAPDTLTIGKPLIVTGTTTFGIGTPIDVVLYYQLTTSTEIKRKIVYVGSDRTFRVVFDTTDLRKGMYKVEVPATGLSDSSVPMRLVNLVSRTDEISITSSQTQMYNGRLYVAGSLSQTTSSGVQIEVLGPGNTIVYGPSYINTNNNGGFSADIPIKEPGDYEVSFTDSRGYIGNRVFFVVGNEETIAPVTTATTVSVLSAHGKASRINPAYFVVHPGSGSFKVYTSSSVDWVVEYVDERGILHMANDQGELHPEEIRVTGRGKPMYFKVYPYKYSVSSEAFLYAENAQSVSVSQAVPAVFGTPVPTATTQTSPASFALAGIAVCVAGFFLTRKRS